jgi:hypothetical protein
MPQLQQTGGYRVHIPYTIMDHLEPSTTFEPCLPLMPNPKPKTLGIIITTHHNHLKIKKSDQTCLHPIESKLVMTNLTITKQAYIKQQNIRANNFLKVLSISILSNLNSSLLTYRKWDNFLEPRIPKTILFHCLLYSAMYHPFVQGSKL